MACEHSKAIAEAPRRCGGSLPEKGACLGAAALVVFALGAAAFLGAVGAMSKDCEWWLDSEADGEKRRKVAGGGTG